VTAAAHPKGQRRLHRLFRFLDHDKYAYLSDRSPDLLPPSGVVLGAVFCVLGSCR
jgi:hypothetical protein